MSVSRGCRIAALVLVAAGLGFCWTGTAAADTILAVSPNPHFQTFPPSGDSTFLNIQSSPFSFSSDSPTGSGVLLSGLAIQPNTGAVYASSGQGGHHPGSLFSVNPANGSVSLIGATGSQGVTALAFSLDGKTLYGSGGTRTTGGPGSNLITINPGTGQGTLLPNPYGIYRGDLNITLASLAFDPLNGVLYGGSANPDGTIFTVDPKTGLATPFSQLTGPATFDNITVDASNALITGLTFDSAGNLFASLIIPADDSPFGQVTLAPGTSTFNQLGVTTGFNVSDIAAVPLAPAAVPEPGTLALLGLGVLGLLGYRRRARR